MDDTTTRRLYPSRLKSVGWLALSAAVTAAGVGLIVSGEWIGWLPAVFSGLGVMVFAVNLLPNSAYLQLSEDGFTVCSVFRAHSYRWSDVGPFCVGKVGSLKMVMFNLSEDYPASPRLRKAASMLAGYEGGLPDTYGMRAEELADLLNRYRDRYGADDAATVE